MKQMNRSLALIAHAKALQQANQLTQARKIYLEILKSEPQNIDVLHLMGILHHQLKDYETAIKYFNKVIKLNTRIPQLYHNLGLAYKEQGDLPKALNCYQTAITLKPDYAAAYEKIGNALCALGQYQNAIDHYQKSLQLNPNNAEAWNNCGNAFRVWEMPAEAQECFQNAVRLQPNFKDALINLAYIIRDQGKPEEALKNLEAIHKIYPEDGNIKINLFSLYDNVCNWQNYENRQQTILQLTKTEVSKNTNPTLGALSALAYEWQAQDVLALAKLHAKTYEKQAQLIKPVLDFKFTATKKSKLKVAYMSSDFHNHPVAYLTNNLFVNHDRNHFEIFGLSLAGPNESIYRKNIMAGCDHFIDFFLIDDKEAAKQIYQHNIDILIDLNGYTKGARPSILAVRPAAIQAHYLGYLGTTGANFYDYILADDIVIPPQTAATAYSEQPVYLPHYQIFDDQQLISDKPLTRKNYNLPADAFVYCCFNNAYKIQPKIFSIWMEILKQTPNAVLWLYSNTQLTENNLRREAQQRGVDPARLIFTKFEERSIYLARYRLADLFLDTLFYNANTTGTDALWAGLPLLTCPTANFAGRGATSSLTALGLTELIAADLVNYQDQAIYYYQQRDELKKIRAKLAANKTTQPLFNTKQFVSNLEKAYWQMWEIFARGEKPRSIYVKQ